MVCTRELVLLYLKETLEEDHKKEGELKVFSYHDNNSFPQQGRKLDSSLSVHNLMACVQPQPYLPA